MDDPEGKPLSLKRSLQPTRLGRNDCDQNYGSLRPSLNRYSKSGAKTPEGPQPRKVGRDSAAQLCPVHRIGSHLVGVEQRVVDRGGKAVAVQGVATVAPQELDPFVVHLTQKLRKNLS